MKKYFILSDIHSFYDQMRSALDENGFEFSNPEHIIIVCGDLLDRGEQSSKVVDFFYILHKRDRVILIRGNHEDLFDEMISTKRFNMNDIYNCTIKTLGQLMEPPLSETATQYFFDEAIQDYDKRWDYLRSKMLNYYELGDYIFVHGWIPLKIDEDGDGVNNTGLLYDPDWRNADHESWYEARWVNGMKMALNNLIVPGKIVVCGHWHTSYGHCYIKNKKSPDHYYREFDADADFSIFKYNGVIAIDACTAHTDKCNCLVLNEDEIWLK